MSSSLPWQQPDLFAGLQQPARRPEMPPEFVERIRRELNATLALVTKSTELPWRDPTAATLAELRFKSVADWLPSREADDLRNRFGREMLRLWEAASRAAASDEGPED
jgi:hypothetical protein